MPLSPKWNDRASRLFRGEMWAPIRLFFFLLSKIYGAVVWVRNLLYDKGIFSQRRLSIPVISVGNLVAGGGGKTPFTLLLAANLAPKRVAVLSRGYGSQVEREGVSRVMCRGEGPLLSPEEGGDEAYLMAKSQPSLIVVVGPNRFRSAQLAMEEGAQVILLDDGMQHRALGRDQEVVLVDATCPDGHGHLLPRGILREPLSSLKRADLVVVTKCDHEKDFLRVCRFLSPYLRSPVAGATWELEEAGVDQGTKVGLYCGVARPEQVARTVGRLGVELVETLFAPDHGRLSLSQLESFTQVVKEKGGERVLTTTKDIVKLPCSWRPPLPWVALEAFPQIRFGQAHWQAFLNGVK